MCSHNVRKDCWRKSGFRCARNHRKECCYCDIIMCHYEFAKQSHFIITLFSYDCIFF